MSPEYIDITVKADGTWTADARLVYDVRTVSGRVGHIDNWAPDEDIEATIECGLYGTWEWPDDKVSPIIVIEDVCDLHPNEEVNGEPMVIAAVEEAVDKFVCGVTA